MKPADIEDICETSPTQAGMLYHSLLDVQSGVYLAQPYFYLRGDVDVDALERAWQFVVDRHAALRTSFHWKELDKPVQVVRRAVRVPFETRDWRELTNEEQHAQLGIYLEQDRRQGIALNHAPLMRLLLIRVEDSLSLFVWTYHMTILDGWSLPIIMQEVVSCYEAFREGREASLPHVKPYSGYVRWLQSQDTSDARRFWKSMLSENDWPAAVSEVCDCRDQRLSATEAGIQGTEFVLGIAASKRLRETARSSRVSMNTLLVGAWSLLLARYSDQSSTLTGVVLSGRPPELDGVERIVGTFVNTVPVRIEVDAEGSVRRWLNDLGRILTDVGRFGFMPLSEIQRVSGVSRRGYLESVLVFENYPKTTRDAVRSSSVSLEPGEGVAFQFERSNFPLAVCLVDDEDGLSGNLVFDAGRYDKWFVRQLTSHFESLLSTLGDSVDGPVRDLGIDIGADFDQAPVSGTRPERGFADACIHHCFEKQAAEQPDAVATVSGAVHVSYASLNARANQLAHHLITLGARTEIPIALCVERGPAMALAALGILKAGSCYVPLDPTYPDERLRYMLDDSRVQLLVGTERAVRAHTELRNVRAVLLERDIGEIAGRPTSNPSVPLSPDNLAYVLYTSGSTGRPKGVAIAHRSTIALLDWIDRSVTPEERGNVLGSSSLSFDCSIYEMFAALCLGGRLSIVDGILDLPGCREPVTLVNGGPSAVQALIGEHGLPTSTRIVTVGGEVFPSELAMAMRAAMPDCRVVNLYGPTEDTSFSTAYFVEARTEGSLPIGQPIDDSMIRVLSRIGHRMPVGCPGEFFIGGAGLARGYLNKPALTAERFVPDPWSAVGGARLYRSGDRGLRMRSGNLRYLGRKDQQIKLRGFRIELGEIEAILQELPVIEAAVAVSRDGEIIAYVVSAHGAGIDTDELARELSSKVPDHLVPARIIHIDSMPRLPNGKVDRQYLADRQDAPIARRHVAPRNRTESEVCEVWAKFFGLAEVGIEDDFFDLGGNSLTAFSLVNRMNRRLDSELQIGDLLENPTIAKLVRALLDTSNGKRRGRQLVVLQPEGSQDATILWLHPIGGGVYCYRDVVSAMGRLRRSYGLQSSALVDEHASSRARSVEALVAEYVEIVNGAGLESPFVVAGWSAGGTLAFEMGRQLAARGCEVALVVMLDSSATTDRQLGSPKPTIREVVYNSGLPAETADHYDGIAAEEGGCDSIDALLQELGLAPSTPAEMGTSWADRLIRAYLNGCRQLDAYRPRGYEGRVLLFRATEEVDGRDDPSGGWNDVCRAGLTVCDVPANHYSIMRYPAARRVAGVLNANIDQALKRIGPEDTVHDRT